MVQQGDVYGGMMGRPLSARHNTHNKSANQTANLLYYSSEGSNGGTSPPPELPLLSGVPPPGLQTKRPTVVVPGPSKLNVQIHKPATLK